MNEYKTYIGDGVYAEFDGFSIILTTENGYDRPTNTIVIEPSHLDAINNFYKNMVRVVDSPNY